MSSRKESAPIKSESGFIHLLGILAIAGLFISALIPINRHYNDGKSTVAGVFLAKGGDDNSGSSSGESGSGSSSGGDSGSRGSDSSGSSSGSSEIPKTESGSNKSSGNSSAGSAAVNFIKNILPNSNRPIKTEVKERGINQRIETRTTPEKIKSDIRQGNLRMKFEIENGKVKIETKVRQGEDEIELEDEAENEAIDQLEAELEEDDIKIATAPGAIALVNKRVGALSNFPLSVDPTTRQLTVTTPAGTKVVTVLPQQAIDNMLAAHVIDDIVSETVENSLASVPDLVNLEVKNDVLGYKVKGTKTHKLLGFIPIKTGVEAFVSAENGQVVESIDSLLGRILNRLAP